VEKKGTNKGRKAGKPWKEILTNLGPLQNLREGFPPPKRKVNSNPKTKPDLKRS